MYLLLFYKPSLRFIHGHALTHLWSPIYASFIRSVFFCLLLAITALFGFGRRGSFSSHIYPYMSITVDICPMFGLFIFTNIIFQQLGFWKNLEDSALFLRNTLSIFDVWSFWRIQTCRRLWYQFPRELVGSSVQFFSELSALVSGLLIVQPLVWRCFCGILLLP